MRIALCSPDQPLGVLCSHSGVKAGTDFTTHNSPGRDFGLIWIVNAIAAITAVLNMQNNSHSFKAGAAGV